MKHERPIRIQADAQPNRGSWNMAVDEALLESAIQSGISTIRVYRWSEPTLSLGYFQDPADVVNDEKLSGLPMVRRLSGGGAIVHHHEITYSVTLAARYPEAGDPTRVYSLVHAAVIGWLREHQVSATLRGPAIVAGSSNDGAFLCFSRGDPHDVLLNGVKILGSAQRRRRGAVLQHGSLVLRTSEFAPHLPGLFDLTDGSESISDDIDAEEFATVVAAGLAESLLRGALTFEEEQRAERFERERYSSVNRERLRR